MKLNIVGGGFTGCVLALKAAQLGAEVTLFEASNELGGIVRDLQVGEERFYNGCHYLDDNEWVQAIRTQLPAALIDFVHEYGSITELFGSQEVAFDFAQPVINDTTKIDLVAAQTLGDRLVDRLSVYGKYSKALITWAERYGFLEQLHKDCAQGMQVPRIFFKARVAELIKLKAENLVIDQLTGIPRSILNPHQDKATGFLPARGFTSFFSDIQRLLESSGVDVRLSSPIKPVLSETGKIESYSRGQHFQSDRTIWCANPTALLMKAGIGRLDSPYTDMYCATALLDNVEDILPIYHQVFSNQSSIVRLFVYRLAGKNKVTIEGFANQQSESELSVDLARYLEILKLPSLKSSIEMFKQRRYANFTPHDKSLIEQFNKNSSILGMLPGAWHIYGRDQKINFMEGHLKGMFQ